MTEYEILQEIQEIKTKITISAYGARDIEPLTVALIALYDSFVHLTLAMRRKS